jgi:hypothetical protein
LAVFPHTLPIDGLEVHFHGPSTERAIRSASRDEMTVLGAAGARPNAR